VSEEYYDLDSLLNPLNTGEEEEDLEEELPSEGEFYDNNVKENTYEENDVFLSYDSPAIEGGIKRRVAAEEEGLSAERQALLDSIPDKEEDPYKTKGSSGEEEKKTELGILADEVSAMDKEDEPAGFLESIDKKGAELLQPVLDLTKALAKEQVKVAQDPLVTARILLGGIGDAAQEAANSVIDYLDIVDDAEMFGLNFIEKGAEIKIMDKLIPKGNHVSEDLLRGVVSFGVGFGAISKALKVSKTANALFNATGRPLLARGAATGGMADLMVFDPDDGNLSTLLREEVGLKWDILTWLDSTEAPTRLEGRIRNVVEGGLIGTGFLAAETAGFLTGITMAGLKFYKNRRTFGTNIIKRKVIAQKAAATAIGQEPKNIKKLEDVVKDDFIAKVKTLETDMSVHAHREATAAKRFAEAAGIDLPPLSKLTSPAEAEHKAVQGLLDLVEGRDVPSHVGHKSNKPYSQQTEKTKRLISTIREIELEEGIPRGRTDEDLWKEYRESKKMTLKQLLAHPEPERFTWREALHARVLLGKVSSFTVDIADLYIKEQVPLIDYVRAQSLATEVTTKVDSIGSAKSEQLHIFKVEIPNKKDKLSLEAIQQIHDLVPEGEYRRQAKVLTGLTEKQVEETVKTSKYMPWMEALLEVKVTSMLNSVTTLTKNVAGLTAAAGLTVVESKVANTIGRIRARIHNNPDLITHTGAASAEVDVLIKTVVNSFILGAEDIRIARGIKTKRSKKQLKEKRKNSSYEKAKSELSQRTQALQRLKKEGRKGTPVYSEGVEGSGKVEAMRRRKIVGADLSPNNPGIAEVIDIVGDIVNLTSVTGLVTSDEFYKTMFMNMFKERMWVTKKAGLMEAGVSEKEISEAYEIHMSDETIRRDARKYSEYLSLTNPIPASGDRMVTSPEGRFEIPDGKKRSLSSRGTVSKGVESFIRAWPGSRVVIPFLNVGLNASRMAVERVPGVGFALPEVRQAFSQRKENPAAWNTVLARWSVGGTIMAIGVLLSKENMVTGNGPGNKEQYIFWSKDLGNVPNSFRMGNKWLPLSLFGPFGDIMAAGAAIGELANYAAEHEASLLELAPDLALLIGTIYEPEYLVENMGNISKIIRDSDEAALSRFLTAQGQSLIPRFIHRIRRDVDPFKRVTAEDITNHVKEKETPLGYAMQIVNETINKIKNSIPGWSSSLPKDINRLGRPILYPEGFSINSVSPIASTAIREGVVEDELNRLNMSYAPLVEKEVLKKLPNGKNIPVFIKHLGSTIQPRKIRRSFELNTKQRIEYKRLAAGLSPTEDSREGLLKNVHNPSEGTVEPLYQVLERAVKNGFKDIPKEDKKLFGEDYSRRSWLYNTFESYRKQAEDQLFVKYFLNDMIHIEKATERGGLALPQID